MQFFKKMINKNDSEILIQFCSPNSISLAWKAKKLGKMCTVRSLWAPCTTPVHPLCNPCANLWETCCLATLWPLYLRPFWNCFGILLHKVQGILLHKIKRYCSTHKGKANGILLHHLFLVDFPFEFFFPAHWYRWFRLLLLFLKSAKF